MRAHDKYKGIKENTVVAVLQVPGEAPVPVDLQKGFQPAKPAKSDPKSTETPNDV